ncbi:MAG: TonB-dependent receptor [Chloroherpetonaceae bacterium]|nr:TonB-dependent receptor [Chloroherpetonaceae bacterium]
MIRTNNPVFKKAIFRYLSLTVLFLFKSTQIFGYQVDSSATSKQSKANDSLRTFTSEIITVTGTRIPTIDINVPRSLTVLTEEDIRNTPQQSVQDLMQYVTGVSMNRRGSNGVQADVGIRGGTFEQTLVLINGNKMSDPQTGHHNFNLPVALDDIERVEVLRGGASRLFGPNAFSGVVNIITKKNKSSGVSLDVIGGDFGYLSGTASVSAPLGDYSQRITLQHQRSDGYTTNTDFRTNNFGYTSSFLLGENSFQFNAGYIDKAFGANRFYSPLPNQFEKTRTLHLALNGELKVGNEFFLTPKIYWRRNADDYILDRDTAARYENNHLTNVIGGELQTQFSWALGKSFVGLEFGIEDIESNGIRGIREGGRGRIIGSNPVVFLGSRSRNRGGVNFEHQLDLGEGLTVIGGASVYGYTQYGWQLLPSFDLNKRFNDQIRVYLSAGRSFRVPTYTELFYQDPVNLSNPDLNPESAWNYEAGFSFSGEGISLTTSLFRRDGVNMIDWAIPGPITSTTVWQASNVSSVVTNGLELMLNFNIQYFSTSLPIYDVKMSYAFLDQSRDVGGLLSRYVFNYMRHQVMGEVLHTWGLGIMQSWKARYEYRGAFSNPNRFIVDTRLYRTFDFDGQKLDVYADVTNLLNTQIQEIPEFGLMLPGRWAMIGVKFQF